MQIKKLKKFIFHYHFYKKKKILLVFHSLGEEDFNLNGEGFKKLESIKKSKKQITLLKMHWLVIKIWSVLMDSLHFHSAPVCCVRIGTGIYVWKSDWNWKKG